MRQCAGRMREWSLRRRRSTRSTLGMASILRDWASALATALATAVATAVRAPLAIHPRDIGLFWQSAKTDAAIVAAKDVLGARGAFEAAYTASADPWRSASQRYRYQRRKYEVLVSLLPRGRTYANVLDLGSGLGTLTRLLAPRADHVLGLDLAQAAVDRASRAASGLSNVEFRQGDAAALPRDLDGQFDLIVVADTLYYLMALGDDALDAVIARIADLLAVGGTVLVANHYFSRWDRDSRLSRRIHDRFIKSANFKLTSEHRRPFYLASLLDTTRQAAR
jgi:SAM-dependent methyltransferase